MTNFYLIINIFIGHIGKILLYTYTFLNVILILKTLFRDFCILKVCFFYKFKNILKPLHFVQSLSTYLRVKHR